MQLHRQAVQTLESALKIDQVKNPLQCQGLEPMSVLHLAFQSDTLPAELSLLQKITACGGIKKRHAVQVHQFINNSNSACGHAELLLMSCSLLGLQEPYSDEPNP